MDDVGTRATEKLWGCLSSALGEVSSKEKGEVDPARVELYLTQAMALLDVVLPRGKTR